MRDQQIIEEIKNLCFSSGASIGSDPHSEFLMNLEYLLRTHNYTVELESPQIHDHLTLSTGNVRSKQGRVDIFATGQNHTIAIEFDSGMSKRVHNQVFKISVAQHLVDQELAETDLSSLTVAEIIGKIRDFIRSEPKDEDYVIFTHYLADYPVSMCKRDISLRLKILIGFHYRLGVPSQEDKERGISAVSYEDLSRIFGRSKASISECVNATEDTWTEFQRELQKDKELESIAERELIEERKRKLRESDEKNIERTKEQTNEPS